MDLKTKLVKFSKLPVSYKYNMFFNPNICHVCKSPAKGMLISCERCHMISYCTLAHKILHRTQHLEICIHIEQLLKDNPWYYNCRFTLTEWAKSREELARFIQNKMLFRALEDYEIYMILYAKSCLICHRQTELNTCNVCFCANYCVHHSTEFHEYHDSICKNLLLSLNIEIGLIENPQPKFKFQMLNTFPDKSKCYYSIIDLFRLHEHPKNEKWDARPSSDKFLLPADYAKSEYITDSLTVYYGLKDARLTYYLSGRVCVIHIISIFYSSRKPDETWELLLHLLHNNGVQEILLVCNSIIYKDIYNLHLTCLSCKLNKKMISVERFPFSYENYVLSSRYKRPNVIIGYGMTEETLSKNCLTYVRRQNCPLILTSSVEYRMINMITYIRHTLNTTTLPIIIKNRFKSLQPRKRYDSISISYRNNFVIVYKYL